MSLFSIQGEKDFKKYEKARELKGKVDKIREDYMRDMKSTEMAVRQRAVALYFIDKVRYLLHLVLRHDVLSSFLFMLIIAVVVACAEFHLSNCLIVNSTWRLYIIAPSYV